jgi:replicative DNA helicase Mcm
MVMRLVPPTKVPKVPPMKLAKKMIDRKGTDLYNAPIQPQLLRKYISYAKQIKPVLTEEAMNRIQDFYLQMRTTDSKESPVTITARQLESLIRLTEARAKVSMRKEISIDDAQAAILLMKKSLEQVGIDTSSGKMDIDLIMTGTPKSLRDKLQAVITILAEVEKVLDFGLKDIKIRDPLKVG